MIGVSVLGCTGSIGASTLDVLARHEDRFQVAALAARANVERMFEQCRRFRPALAVLTDRNAAGQLALRLRAEGLSTRVEAGAEALIEAATLPSAAIVMAALSGAAGLPSTLAAAGAGKRLLLANKESAVMAGSLLMAAVRRGGATLIPIDSEHNAIFQCLPAVARMGEHPPGVRRLTLTASGGPFRDWSLAAMQKVTPQQACAHPRWVMGRKISVDSATLMNKGLELIEATVLFGVPATHVDVVVHPESVVHSLVEYLDGSVLAQLGSPDMRTPIAQALAWPGRLASGVQSLDLLRVGSLGFQAPDRVRFPCLRLAEAAAQQGGLAPLWLNAADEVAVQAFLDGGLNFGDIAGVIESVMTRVPGGECGAVGELLAADAEARACALEVLAQQAARYQRNSA